MTDNNQRTAINNTLLQSCKQELALYVVATPIGNMEDITLRAIKTLANVDVIACEDTRITQNLLSRLNIKSKLICYNDHSGEKERDYIESLLISGKSVALVSDAGTPLISDPGYKLIRRISDAGIKVTSIPGASSVSTALTLCALPTDRFFFEGFLPPKSGARINALNKLKEINATLIFFESAKRLVSSIADIGSVFKEREICILREITKKFEEIKRGTSEELEQYYKNNPPKGEIVIVVAPPNENEVSNTDIIFQLSKALESMSVKDAVALVADNNGVNKKDVYNLALNIKK
ncbi:MAG: 16S rRNA (cytidine(1402)-2'-O)-methyltransferase [Rickettsiales bacterium]|nr:16S rRNA (cytidine(1402)-2'-O)-methyltransferase [Pseudomonadota bacterium]MDA0966798.1 16S rRNA (cytidine(1402)-2'-O)-methyltransferase [Pseudomonadota bacterium]MDG4543470.1 16S rRNA (cytidine(1402)-2'-O)-methyltransferase [Rickettsiales bacterium]MDG4546136.1 16S rRNA (cytidine(1402)-2'-O)-methyltransferase [Rickettsiales bacterium]MDG4547609.1 16S rRNA (cytidine(1402)-2'-O)-methyltransferase [Rickettsiales bacterium]